MNLLIIDDHTLFRKGLILLVQELDAKVSFLEAESAPEALALSESNAVDLILLDLHLSDASGLDTLNALAETFQVPVVMLSSDDNPMVVKQCIDSGASGFIPKSSTPQVLIAAMQLILSGGVYLPPNVLTSAESFMTSKTTTRNERPSREYSGQRFGRRKDDISRNIDQDDSTDSPLSHLSDRQMQVLKLAIQGKANKVIARELDLSEGTVKAHMSAAYRALNVKNRSEAVFKAASLGINLG